MKTKNTFLILLVIGLVSIAALIVAVYLGMPSRLGLEMNEAKTVALKSQTVSPESLDETAKGVVEREAERNDEWKTYRNDELGFEFQYPGYYEVSYDRSGWPRSVALLCNTRFPCQAYDVVVELWDTYPDLGKEYPGLAKNSDVKILQSGERYLSIMGTKDHDETNRIVESFRTK